ncbi:MAG: hypothetical protein WC785_09540 [Tatlockia sp.]
MIAGNYQTALRSHSLFLTVLTRALLGIFILSILVRFFPEASAPDATVLVEYFRKMIYPKSTERFLFVTTCMALPLYTLFLIYIQENTEPPVFGKLQALELPLIAALVLFLPLISSDYLLLLAGKDKLFYHPNVLLISSLFASALGCLLYVKWKPLLVKAEWTRALTWTVWIGCLFLLVLAWRIAGVNAVNTDGTWSIHADVAVYATSQVVAGKTLLVDLPSQYGLFPEFIAPLFKRIGTTFLNFALFFATLQCISMIGLFYVLSKLIKNSALLLLVGLSLLVITFTTMLYLSGLIDRYFQYWPIRFFWPALSVLVFYHFARKQTLASSAVLSLASAVGTLWVMDTGLFIVIAFAVFLAAKWTVYQLFNRASHTRVEPYFYLKALGLHFAIVAATFILFFTALYLKAHQPLHLSWLFTYQQVFYGLGFMMIPMPHQLHPWMSVLGIYLFGVVLSLLNWAQREEELFTDCLFYLSVLGIGMFFYYEGRSHVYNLVTVSWPAFMLIALVSDRVLYRMRKGILPLTEIWLPLTGITVLLVCSVNFVTNMPRMVMDAQKTIATFHQVTSPYIADEIAFIKKYAKASKNCFILAQRQGIYYAESGMYSPVKGPGLVETVLQSDLDALNNQMKTGKLPCIILGTGPFSVPFVLGTLPKLTKKYDILDENAAHTLYYLEPKKRVS